MDKILFLLILPGIASYLIRDIKTFFETINEETLKFNSVGADIAWEASVKPSEPDLVIKSTNYQKYRILWEHETCNELATLFKNQLLNSTQKRQSYLLCRGPKFTFEEAKTASSIYQELQSIYSDAEICIPIDEHTLIKNETIIEDTILNYLSKIKQSLRNSNNERGDPISVAAKMAVYSNFEKSNQLCLQGENDFEKIMRYSTNEEVLKWLWLVWREKVGPPMRQHFMKMVDVENLAARRNGYQNIGAVWRDELEIPRLRQLCRQLYNSIRPIYSLLHGVVRFYLRRFYGNIVPEYGAIPSHLLGNLWSHNWDSLSDIIFPNNLDLDESIRKLNWTVKHMVKQAEDFYQSMGLPAMTDKFWRESIFARTNNSNMRCHGTAADMFKTGDYRLLYCAEISIEDFYVIHHEMGHLQYYMAYSHQPALYRQANTAFHEAIGDTIMYGVLTPQHLNRLNLINDSLLYASAETNFEEEGFNKRNSIDINKNPENIKEEYNGEFKSNVKKNIDLQSKVSNKNVKYTFALNNNKGKLIISDKPLHTFTFENNLNSKQKYDKLKKDSYNIYKPINKKPVNFGTITAATKGELKDKPTHAKDTLFHFKEKYNTLDSELTKLYHEVNTTQLNLRHNEFNSKIDDIKLFDKQLSTDTILLIKQALNKVPQIPFSLLMDEYRWRYFEGSLVDKNKAFWDLALELQGIAPPADRDEEYFDVGAKFHLADNTPYIRYFLSSFLQHQLFESLCKSAIFGYRNADRHLPKTISINKCDIYGSKAAGKLLKDFMSRGNSQHWSEILQAATGENTISASAFQRYYRPLYKELNKFVRKHRIPIGW